MSNPTDEQSEQMRLIVNDFLFEILSKRAVWFMIDRNSYGEYRILMYYDNGYNQANGDDL